MLELKVGGDALQVEPASNLLDNLLSGGFQVAHSCRAGSCQSCKIRCLSGELDDAQPDALSAEQRAQGWRLACQCRVMADAKIELFNPSRDALPAQVCGSDWLSADVLRLRLKPQQPLRYRAGQHLQVWITDTLSRPYSLASLADEDAWLELHIDCAANGAFTQLARGLKVGDGLRLGGVAGGALHYDPQWHARPLWLLAAGTGLAPLYGLLREALRQQHSGPIKVVHVARNDAEHYLRAPLSALAEHTPSLQLEYAVTTDLAAVLAQLRLVPRQALALLCGGPESVERFARSLYLGGLPRNQMLSDIFIPRAP